MWTHPHYHHPPQHSDLEAASWTLPRLLLPPMRTDPFPISHINGPSNHHGKSRTPPPACSLPASELSPPQESHKHKSIIQKGRENGEHLHIWRTGRRLRSQTLSTLSVLPPLCTEPHHPTSLPLNHVSPGPTANRHGVCLDAALSPWQGAPGPRERKPAGQAQ